ncbi:MAG TPA: serine/threonine-protein kinase [Solirubrobacterales bacterium]|nr:serine/threonine-protein kinase [Solirubrobacterales bacterium]
MGEPSIGSTLAGYRIDSLIARGGMGVVYRATQVALDRPVALKVIARELAEDAGFRERFLRESRLAARLDHPAVVPVYDAREEDGELIVAMRLVEGGDLRKLIRREGPLAPARAIALLGQVADALDAAHAAGIVHRDVKPHNVLVEGDRAYLSDFGLAKLFEAGEAGSGASIVGTVEYMAPEQWRGEKVGPAADVYALGCVLYEALTGVAPFARKEGDTEPELPKGIEAVIGRAVAKDPADRYPTATALIEAAGECQGATPAVTQVLTEPDAVGLSRWRRPIGAAFLFVFLGGAAALVLLVAFLLSFLGGDDVSVSDPIAVASPPLRLAVGPDRLWVTSATDGTLTAIDAPTGDVALKRRLGRGLSGVAIGAGSVWVSNPRTGVVLRTDADGRVTVRVPVGGRPGAVTFAGGRLWVADEAGSGVSAIDAATNRLVERGIEPRAAPLRLAAGAGAVWVSNATAGTVRRIDLITATADAPIRVGRGPAGITTGGGLVWVANSRSGTVTRVDPSIRAILGDPIPVGARPGGIGAGTTTVWVASTEEATVTRLDIHTGESIGDPIGVPSDPGAIAVGSNAVWVASNNDGTITRIEP